jgi:hypothetical protein
MVNCAPPPFYKHRVNAPLQARCQDRPREEAEQRRDVTRRGLPAVAPQLEAHNPKEAEPRGAASPVHRERMTVLLIASEALVPVGSTVAAEDGDGLGSAVVRR